MVETDTSGWSESQSNVDVVPHLGVPAIITLGVVIFLDITLHLGVYLQMKQFLPYHTNRSFIQKLRIFSYHKFHVHLSN